jgi:hypothetical protein
MSDKIRQVREMLRFCEEGHDIDGTWPHPFLLRSFAVEGNNIKDCRMKEHYLRIEYYKNILQDLLEDQQNFEKFTKKQRFF